MMFKVVLRIKGDTVMVEVTDKETNECRTDFTHNIFFTPEEVGRAKAEHMIRLWKAEREELIIIEYEVD